MVTNEQIIRLLYSLNEKLFEFECVQENQLFENKKLNKELEKIKTELKVSLYDYYSRRTWLIHEPMEENDNLSNLTNFKFKTLYRTIAMKSINRSVVIELREKLIEPELEQGIIHFYPLIGRNVDAGFDKDNYDNKGIHFHYCIGKKYKNYRTSLLFTNQMSPTWTFYHDQHGPYPVQHFNILGRKVIEAIKTTYDHYKKKSPF